MKNFFLLCIQLGFVFFGLATIMAFLNYLTGWKIGIKGTAIPGDPVAAIAFLVVALICGGISFFITRKN